MLGTDSRVIWRPVLKPSSFARIMAGNNARPEENYDYDLVIITPAYEGLSYSERLNMIWHQFKHMPDGVFSRIRTIDCLTPPEYGHKND